MQYAQTIYGSYREELQAQAREIAKQMRKVIIRMLFSNCPSRNPSIHNFAIRYYAKFFTDRTQRRKSSQLPRAAPKPPVPPKLSFKAKFLRWFWSLGEPNLMLLFLLTLGVVTAVLSVASDFCVSFIVYRKCSIELYNQHKLYWPNNSFSACIHVDVVGKRVATSLVLGHSHRSIRGTVIVLHAHHQSHCSWYVRRYYHQSTFINTAQVRVSPKCVVFCPVSCCNSISH